MAATANPPNAACPKCGDATGWRGPNYQPAYTVQGRGDTKLIPEALLWMCGACNYTVSKKTNDAP